MAKETILVKQSVSWSTLSKLPTKLRSRATEMNSSLLLSSTTSDKLIPLDSTKELRMNLKDSAENVGRVGHETLGAEVLRSLGFSHVVCRLVANHVPAKRYLTAVNTLYFDSLSSASKISLQFQGGPLKGDELAAFDQDRLRDEMVALRLWDDAAKVEGIIDSTPRAQRISGYDRGAPS